MNEVEYILRIVLKARDELARSLANARNELRLFANAMDSHSGKIDAFNKSIETMDRNVANITDKFREWRSIMQGASEGNEDARKSFGQLGREVDTTAKMQQRAARTTKELYQESSRLNQAVKELSASQKAGRVDADYAISQFKEMGRQLENLSKKFTAGTRDSQRVFDWARNAKQAAEQLIAIDKQITADAIAESQKRVRAAEAEAAAKERARQESIRDLQSFVDAEIRTQREGQRITRQIAREDERERKARNARIAAEEAAAAAERVKIARQEADLQRDAAAAQARAVQARERLGVRRALGHGDVAEIRNVTRELERVSRAYRRGSEEERHFAGEAERLRTTLRRVQNDARNTGGIFGHLASAFRGNRDSIATLDNQMRGLGLLALVGFAQQLITVLGGLGGSFLAVASSAAQAGAAIGGTFVAGVGQALPAIGLLGAALFRVSSVMDAVKQAQTAQQQQAVQAATAHRRTADAADTLTNAEESLGNAQRQVTEAQKGLTEARQEARRDLEDLVLAEKNAELAVRGARLSVAEAQEQLRQAIARGDEQEVSRAELGVLQSRLDLEDKLTERRRARVDAAKAERGGVEGMEGVEQAKQALEDATRAADKAARSVNTAKRNATEAAEGTETAAAKLNFLLAQLSPAERRLYDAITNIQKLFREGVYRDITDTLVDSFARSVNKIADIIQMPQVLNLARRTTRTLASQMNRVFDALTGDKMIAQFVRIGEAGRQNLQPVGTIAINVGKALANIAEAGGPGLRRLLRFVSGLVEQFLHLTNRRRALTEFFTEGEKHFEAWVRLGLAVIRFFAALAGAGGARTGLGIVKDATDALDDLTKKLQNNREGVGKFFEDSRKILYEVVGVLEALGKELFKAWRPERVEAFADLLKKVVIPALGDVIEFLGNLTDKIVEFADTPIGEKILKSLFAFFIMQRVFGALLDIVLKFTAFLSPLARLLAPLFSRLAPLVTRILPQLARFVPFVGWAAAIALVLHQLGLLDDVWRALRGAFQAFWREVGPPLRRLWRSFKDLWEAVAEGKGLIGILADVLRPLLRLIISIGATVLRVFGRTFGRVFGGLIDIISGVMDVITGILTGDFGKAWDGIKRIFRGGFRAITAILRLFPELVFELAKDAVKAFGKAWPGIKRWVVRAIEDVWEWLKGFPRRIGNIAEDAAKAFVGAFKGVGRDVIKGIVSGLRDLGGFARDIANAFIDLLNKLLPDKIAVPGAPDINLPDNPIPHLAKGGPAKGGGGGFLAVLHDDEHVWTADEVRRAGGHSAMFAMRRYYGGGGQGQGGFFQEGGRAERGIRAGALTITFQGGDLDNFLSRWREFWSAMVAAARRGTNGVENQFRDMRQQVARYMNLMYRDTDRATDRMWRDISRTLAKIVESFQTNGNRIVRTWGNTWGDLMSVTHKGLFYIGHETNKALHALGEKTINFGYTAPTGDGRAGGGWINAKGHRGRDKGFYPLGAGEAVLNWQHQRYVEPAMNAYYGHGLSTMFDRVHGYHAGGGGTGFASGGYTFAPIPGYPGEEANTRIIPLLVSLMKKYKFIPTDVYDRDHSAGHKSPGHNVTGTALDAVPGPGGSWGLIEAMGKWAVSQGMTVGYGAGVPGSQAWPGHGRGLHIHIELGNNPNAAAAELPDKIKAPKITGEGRLAEMVQAVFDKVLKLANDKIAETFDATSGGATDFTKTVAAGAENIFKFFRQHGFTDEQAAGWVGNFIQESGLDPGAVQPNGEGHGLAQWGGGRFAALMAFASKHGTKWTNLGTQLSFVLYELAGSESAANAAIKAADSVEEATNAIGVRYERYGIQGDRSGPARQVFQKYAGKYDVGGEIPGPLGKAVPIIAHAKEWVLNPLQQARVAALSGLSRSGLKSMLGFYGGGGSYQGGGTPGEEQQLGGYTSQAMRERLRRIRRGLYELPVLPLWSWESVIREAHRAFTAINRSGHALARRVRDINDQIARLREGGVEKDERKQIKDLVEEREKLQKAGRKTASSTARLQALEALTKEGGIIDMMDQARERFTQRLARGLAFATYHFNRATRRVTQRRDMNTDVERTTRELANTRAEMSKILGEEGVINKSLNTVNRRLRQLRRGGVTEREAPELRRLVALQQRLREQRISIRDAHAQQLENIFQAQVARQQAIVDAINQRYERRSARNELTNRIASALGREDLVAKVNAAQRDLLTRQARELERRIRYARRAGATDLANQLADQVADLRVQIFESIQQELRDTMDRINNAAQRRLGRLDIAGRMLDAVGAVGLGSVAGVLGERFTRGGIFAQRGAALATQRAGLQGLVQRAAAQGNVGLVQELTDQLAELEVAIRENTKAYFDARVEDVNNRAQFGLNVNDLNKQITELEGTIGGQIDQQRIVALLQQRSNILNTQRVQLEALLLEAQRTGNQQAVNDLTVALLENRVAILQNTQAVNEATGAITEPQTFTSSAWSWFREAIFSGMGQVLPQYNTANMMSGVNTGAVLIPAGATSNRISGDTNINLYESGRPPSLTEIGAAVVFASKTTQ